jgi:hypothetical protein
MKRNLTYACVISLPLARLESSRSAVLDSKGTGRLQIMVQPERVCSGVTRAVVWVDKSND